DRRRALQFRASSPKRARWVPGFKGGWFVVVAYVVGFIKMLIVIGWNPAPERRPKHGSPGGGVVQVSSIVREDGSGPEALNKSLESFFAVRESRYLAETIGSNKLAELDLYLRQSRLRTPVLEVLGS